MVSRGICGQRGFSKFYLVNKLTGNSGMVAVNPANPSYRPLGRRVAKGVFGEENSAHIMRQQETSC
jgi:hypothetical protein